MHGALIDEYSTPEQRMKFYKSREWRKLRQLILARDAYECQECKRQGKVTVMNPLKHKSLEIHHKRELKTHPELAMDPGNLEVVCIRCHNFFHDRTFENWWGARRYIRPSTNPWREDEQW